MELRILTEPQQGATYTDLLRVAKVAEAAGYGALFRSDHYLKLGDVDGLPGPTDAWTTLAGLARETTRIRLGTLVSPATFRHPSVLAITVAQVDHMSDGRVELGLGCGWFAEEHRRHGIPFPDIKTRFSLYAEQLEIITGFWNTPLGSAYTYHGQHYDLTDSPALPKPLQKPHPPIIVGGGGKTTAKLAARFADEINLIFVNSQVAAERFNRVMEAAHMQGRAAGIVRSLALVPAVGRTAAEARRRLDPIRWNIPELIKSPDLPEFILLGSPAEVVDKIGRYREATGASRFYLEILDLSDLDQIELIASQVMPQLI